jgi:Ca2+-binding RTX toxin-like protein
MSRIFLVAVVAMVSAVAVPSVALGATIHRDGRTPHRVLLQADPGETNLVSVEGSNSVVIRDDGTPMTVAGVPTCMPLDPHAVSCSAVRRVALDLGDGPDVAVIATPREVEIEGGDGPDRYVALANDWPSRVDFDGGIGFDVANYFFATAGVNVSVDLSAGDGRPGDDDRIRRDVECVLGSAFGDVLAGGPRAEHLTGLDGDDQITGGAGGDVLSGGPGTTASTPATASRTPQSPAVPRSSRNQPLDRSDGRPATPARPPVYRPTMPARQPSSAGTAPCRPAA